jgi:hypothetical protein
VLAIMVKVELNYMCALREMQKCPTVVSAALSWSEDQIQSAHRHNILPNGEISERLRLDPKQTITFVISLEKIWQFFFCPIGDSKKKVIEMSSEKIINTNTVKLCKSKRDFIKREGLTVYWLTTLVSGPPSLLRSIYHQLPLPQAITNARVRDISGQEWVISYYPLQPGKLFTNYSSSGKPPSSSCNSL